MQAPDSQPAGDSHRTVIASPCNNIDIVVCHRVDADAKLALIGVRRSAPNASILRVRDVTQVLRLVFQKGLFTPEPQIPRLILLDLSASSDASALEQLRANPSTRSVPIVCTISVCDRVLPFDAQKYINAVARMIAVGLRAAPVSPNQSLVAASSRMRERHFVMLSAELDPTPPGDRLNCVGEFCAEGEDEHHDHRLAHDAAVRAGSDRLLRLDGNHSFKMIRRAGERVLNILTVDFDKVVGVGNCNGETLDKF